ncbi:hypothetical protein Gocc_1726 [Gaiella occulta]|uniref:Uncharacterized protein n=1 Tax=Gaiella occulta TaxID=1002870 RepID=A0A7M2YZB7_9ACTN|nr:hypothetical protein Gocc_1726 [Gaiella occulta]
MGAPIAGATPVKTQYDNQTTSIASEQPQVKAASKGAKSSAKPQVTATAAPTPAPNVASSGELPFTGLNIGLVLLFGAVAIVAGLGLRRVAARRHE